MATAFAAGGATAVGQVPVHGEPAPLDGEATPADGEERPLRSSPTSATGGARRLDGRPRALVAGEVPTRQVHRRIRFGFGKAHVRPRFHVRLTALAEELAGRPVLAIRVAGHTDSVGMPERNRKLSRRRALRACRAAIEALDESLPDCERHGYGMEHPVARNQRPDGADDPDGRRRNRRARISVLVGAADR